MNSLIKILSLISLATLTMVSCSDDDSFNTPALNTPTANSQGHVGAVYAMTNGTGQVEGAVQGQNWVVSYGRTAEGTLDFIGQFQSGGNGGDFDGGEGLDPLISAYALNKTTDNEFLLAVNAGSASLSVFDIQDDFSLELSDTEGTDGVGPNSVAYNASAQDGLNGLVYVSNIARPEFADAGEPAQQGSLVGYWLTDGGDLLPIDGSLRELANRPSAVHFSPDGRFLVVSSINAGSSALATNDQNEIVVYEVNADGTLSASITDGATSTLRDNNENRNLPSAIGFQVVGDNIVVVTEAREFQADGTPPAFPALQDGSVSTWQINSSGQLTPISLDVASGLNNTGRTACWLDFNVDENLFFVSNAIEAGLACYSFDNGVIELVDQIAAAGIGATGNTTDPGAAFSTTEGWIDMWISDDGNFLYQLHGFGGTIGVYRVVGENLEFIQNVSGNLPENNVQGIVAI